MIKANLVSTLIIKRSTIFFGKGKDAEFDITDYQCLVGMLIHLSQTTQSNFAFVVSRLEQYMADLYLGHWHTTKRVL